jgi:hypothetical protein
VLSEYGVAWIFCFLPYEVNLQLLHCCTRKLYRYRDTLNFQMDAKIQRWKALPSTLSDFVCAVPISSIECKALAGILPEQCPRLEQIQVHARFQAEYVFFLRFFCHVTCLQLSLETDAAGAQQLLDMLPCFFLLSSLHLDISNMTHPPTLQHLARTLTVTHTPPNTHHLISAMVDLIPFFTVFMFSI